MLSKKLDSRKPAELAEEADNNSPTKLFEEIKVMFNDIPLQIEKSLAHTDQPRYHNGGIEALEALDLTEYGSPEMAITVALAVLRSAFPWVHDVGHLVLTTVKTKRNQEEKEKLARNFLTILKKSRYYADRRNRPTSPSYQRAFDVVERAIHDLLLGRI